MSIEIIGATSPDGNYVCNKRLALNRAKTILNYLQDSFDLSSFSVNVDSKNIDCDGLTSLVEASNMAHRDDALQILHNTPEWIYSNGVIVDDRRHQLGMLKGGLPYNYMSKNFFEKLRYACVDIKYSSKETGAVKEETIAPVEEAVKLEDNVVDEPLKEDEPIKQEKADEVIDLKVVEEIKPKEEASLGGATVTINNTTKTVANFVPSTTVASQVDLVTTDATVGKKSTNESTGCPLVFKHRLSKIVVAAKNSNTGYTVKVDGVRLVVPNNAGTLDLGTALWTLTAAKGTYEHTGSAQTLSATAADMTATLGCNSFMLLPQTLTDWDGENDPSNASGGAYLALRVNIVSSGGTQLYPSKASAYDWAAVGIATTWEAGKCYKYVLDFTTGAGRVYPEKPTPVAPDTFDAGDLILGSPIKFTVTVEEWVTGTDIDVTM